MLLVQVHRSGSLQGAGAKYLGRRKGEKSKCFPTQNCSLNPGENPYGRKGARERERHIMP